MSFQKRTVLDTQESVYSSRLVGQIVPITSGRLDKISVYLQPKFENEIGDLQLFVDVYEVDGSDIPFGSPIISRSRVVSEIAGNGYFNLPVEAVVPIKVAVVLRLTGGNLNNYVGVKYVDGVDASTEPLLISDDNGITWTKDTSKKVTYVAYSSVYAAVHYNSGTQYGYLPPPLPPDTTDQSATIQAAESKSQIDNTRTEFQKQDLEGTIVQGDTVVINFGNIVVTLIVDQSGSMTWNDRQGVRFEFLNQYIDDLENNISLTGSTAFYNVLKFNGRKIGRMRLILQEDTTSPSVVAGTRIVRKMVGPVLTPTDGVVIYEGLSESLLDKISPPAQCYYGAFSYNMSGVFSEIKRGSATPSTDPSPPMGVASFQAVEKIVPNTILIGPYAGSWDIGRRSITITWTHPQTTDPSLSYNQIILVRRTDRPPENPSDGDVVFDAPSFDGPYYDFNSPYATDGQTYYYAMFTRKTSGTVCLLENARQAQLTISKCDRFWLKLEPPANDPVNYGFYASSVPVPTKTTSPGDSEIEISWIAGSADTKRYELWFSPSGNVGFKENKDGSLLPDGELIYNGPETSFIHRNLENGQPNFYMLLAFNYVATQSSPVNFNEKAVQQTTTIIEPLPPNSFTAEPYNSSSNRLSWSLPIPDTHTYSGYFGDSIRSICSVSFEDESPTMYTGTLKFQELSRTVVNLVNGSPVSLQETPLTPIPATIEINGTAVDTTTLVTPQQAMEFAIQQSTENTIISSIFSSNPLISVQNNMESVEIDFKGVLEVRDRETSELITGIETPAGTITLLHPLTLSIINDPQQSVDIQKWDATCNLDKSPSMTITPQTGVYVQTGDSFNVTIKASFKGAPITDEVPVSFRILDKITGLPSTVCTLPNQDADGISTISVKLETDEILDRTNQPTGVTESVSKAVFELPPQEVPGNYILEATMTYLGYEKIATLEMNFFPSLNIDMDLNPFEANGVNVAEQKAFVYFGDPNSKNKIPVPDNTVIDWAIRPLDVISQANVKKRPFYSSAGIVGTGIKSPTKGGTAKQVFFGPGSDIGIVSDDPVLQSQVEQQREISSCITDGEIYEISATAKVSGMTATGYGTITLTRETEPQDPKQLARIFLRKVSGFNTDTIYADGAQESEWEVVAKPENDGSVDDIESGAYFRERITGLGGLVPSLEDGKIVTLTTSVFTGDPGGQRIMVSTNLTGADGRSGYAKARIENGVAKFKLRLNAVVSGTVKEVPLAGESGAGGNLIYGSTDTVAWQQSALIYSLTAYTILEVDGQQVTFYGGGSNLYTHTPPCFLSFTEPLNLYKDTSGGEP